MTSPPIETPQDEAGATSGDSSQATAGSFDDLQMPEKVREGLRQLGYSAPTPVQREVFPHAITGKDMVVQSKTGSGKTTAFALPVAVQCDPTLGRTQALVLCPTRELALQVSEEATRLLKPSGLECVAVYGGASFGPQVEALKRGAALVVGTPGRITDQIERGNFKLSGVKHVVLDEADEMLNQGFWEDVTRILKMLPKEKQTLLFSATMPDEIERAARSFMNDPVRLKLSGDTYSVEGIENLFYLVDENLPKPRNFLWVLEMERPRSAIVFANTRAESEMLNHYLRRFGFDSDLLNGDLAQKDRERVMRKVKAGELDMMVATDIAARGIDISDLSHVFNYDLPEDPEVYIHRVGRTGRIGKKGIAVSLVRGRFESTLDVLRKKFNVPLQQKTLPHEREVIKMQSDRLTKQLRDDASGVEFAQYKPVAEEMMKAGDANELIAFLLRSYYAARKPRAATDAEGSAPQSDAPDGVEKSVSAEGGRRDRGPRGDRPRREERGPKEARPPREERAPRPPREAPVAAVTAAEGAVTTVPAPAAVVAAADAAPREPRPPRPPREERPVDPSRGALFIGAGLKQGMNQETLKKLLMEKGGLTDEQIQRVTIKVEFSVVDVPVAQVDELVGKLHGQMHGELALRVEPKRRRGDRPGRKEGEEGAEGAEGVEAKEGESAAPGEKAEGDDDGTPAGDARRRRRRGGRGRRRDGAPREAGEAGAPAAAAAAPTTDAPAAAPAAERAPAAPAAPAAPPASGGGGWKF